MALGRLLGAHGRARSQSMCLCMAVEKDSMAIVEDSRENIAK